MLGRSALVVSAIGALLLPVGAAAQTDGQNYTDLPELQTATVVSMRTSAQSSDIHPAGMTVTFQFDEPLLANAPDPADFLVYNRAGVATSATTAEVAADTVTAFFPTVDTRVKATSLSLAVVEENAVSDTNGSGNPVGASGLVRREKYRGSKSCIRLIRVNNLRHVRDHTVLSFHFTSFASCGEGDAGVSTDIRPGRLHLEMTDGRSIPAMKVRYRSIDPQSTHPVVVKAIFPGKRVLRHIARVTAREAAVHYSWWGPGSDDGGDEYNWLQARAISHDGNTIRPDLVAVELRPNTDPQRPGHAIFVFDQRVTDPHARRFSVDQIKGVRAVVVPRHPRQVRVSFPPVYASALPEATDGSVWDGAVGGALADEVPIPNTLTYTTMTDGATVGPDMTSGVYLTQSGPVVAAFRFDAELSGDPVPAAFHLYAKDGTKYDAEQCELMSVGSTSYPDHVRCTFTEAARVPTGDTQLGTVDASAVRDTKGRTNPEGEAPTYAPAVTPWS